jgi:hypothetical protein
MNVAALFGISILMSFLSFGIITRLYTWPRIRSMNPRDAVVPPVVIHTTRFAGLSFLFPGVVSASLPSGFAAPAAYGDLIAAVLAMIAVWALTARFPWALPFVWIFNVWGAADLLNAFYQGEIHYHIYACWLGATFFIPTAIVPPLLVTHGLIFSLFLRARRSTNVPARELAHNVA